MPRLRIVATAAGASGPYNGFNSPCVNVQRIATVGIATCALPGSP
jgi:hypothetical protein